MDFQIATRRQDCHVLLILEGELDVASAPLLVGRVREILRGDLADIRADLGPLRFCDSSGLSALLRVKRLCEKAGGSFAVFGASGGVATVLEITGLAGALGGLPAPVPDPGPAQPLAGPDP